MKKMKRGISLLLSAVLVLGMVSVQGFAMESWNPVDPKGQQDPVQKEEVKTSEEILAISEDSAVVPIAEEKEKLIVTATATVCYGDEQPEYKLVCKDTNGVEKDGIITVPQDRITSTYTKGDTAGKEFDIMVNIEGISHDQYVLEAETGKGTVLPRKLTVALEHAEYAYDGTEHTPKVVVNGLLAGDQLEPEFESMSAEDAGDYSIVISNWNGDEEVKKNYELPVGTELPFAVTKRTAVIDWGVLAVTYDGNEHYPNPVIKNLVENDDVSIVMSLKDPVTAVGEYKIRVESLTGADAGNYDWNKDEEETFTISKPAKEKPVGVNAEPETIRGKADGKITGVDVAMEYAAKPAEGEAAYKKISGETIENLAAGTYLVRYAGTSDKGASEPVEVTVAAGEPLEIKLPTTQTGYTLMRKDTETPVGWGDDVILTFALAKSFVIPEALTITAKDADNKECEVELEKNKDDTYTITIKKVMSESVKVEVDGVKPAIAMELTAEKYKKEYYSVAEKVDVDLYTKGSVAVVIESGLKDAEISYIEASEKKDPTDIEEKEWKVYTKPLSIVPTANTEKQSVFYARVKSGSETYYASTGAVVFDTKKPTIDYPSNQTNCYVTQIIAVTDENLDYVTVDGQRVNTLPIKLNGTVDKDDVISIVAYDKAGNSEIRRFTIKPRSTLTQSIDSLDGDNMTSAYQNTVENVLNNVNSIIDSQCKNATQTEKAELNQIVDKCKGLLLVLDIQALPKASSVKPDDVETLNEFLEVARAYKALSTSSQNTLGADNKKILEDLYKALTDYDITTKEASLKWTLKSKKTLEVAVNGPASMLKEVRIDGDKLDKDDDYTSKAGTSGGTVITLKAAYLDKLKAGKHTIQIEYEYGKTDGKDQIQILNANGTNPKTGDTGVLFWTTASVLSLACLAAVTISGRKRKFQA